MALSGTLKDFGIADILQLIGHQTKTGRLVLKSGHDEVDVLFVDGTVVFATQKARNKADMLGSLLRRADLINTRKLEEALTEQQRSLKRLGDVLVQQKHVDAEKLSQVMRLQTTETLYKLFRWKTGTYEFTQEDVDAASAGFEPIRAEAVLLEGFRRMDEWPAVRKKIPWNDATFEQLKDLNSPPDGDGGGGTPAENHRLVYALAAEGRTAEKIADVSLLGEFEALRALDELLRLESALELYRLEHGEYPRELRKLVEGRLVGEDDLRYPYRGSYHYRRTPQGFVLLPPLD